MWNIEQYFVHQYWEYLSQRTIIQKNMDQDIFRIIMSIIHVIIIVVDIVLYHRVQSHLERLEHQLKLGEWDDKEFGSNDKKKKDNYRKRKITKWSQLKIVYPSSL